MSETTPIQRTQDEIVAEIEKRRGCDFFGVQTIDLATYLDFEHAHPFLREGTKAEDWQRAPFTLQAVLKEIRDYIPFAKEKRENDRSLSCARATHHFAAWFWLFGDDVFKESQEWTEGFEDFEIVDQYAEQLLIDLSDDHDQFLVFQLSHAGEIISSSIDFEALRERCSMEMALCGGISIKAKQMSAYKMLVATGHKRKARGFSRG